MDLASVLLALAAAWGLVTLLVRRPAARPLFGVYAQPGRWFSLKYAAFLLLLRLRRLRKAHGSDKRAGMGVASRNSPAEMERPQQLPDERKHPHAVDAVYFNGADQLGNNLIMAASRRQHSLLQCISILRLSGIGLLEHPSQPDTNFTVDEGGDSGFSKSDMRIECLEPMQAWKLEFDGEMTLLPESEAEKRRSQLGTTGGGGRRVRVRAQLTWRALHRQFDFDTDQDSHPLAEAVAGEEWSGEMFKRLESVHQTHYEQFGEITGPVYIDGEKVTDLKLQGARDHSYGNHRVWSDLYRYGLQYIYLEDRTCIAVGCVSMPNYLSNLIIGFVCTPDGRVIPLRQSDFRLYNEGQDGRPSTDFRIRCLAGGQAYTVQCRVADQAVFCMGAGAEVRIYERFCDFEVNGVRGWGVSEWCYRNSEAWHAWEQQQ